MQERTHCMVPFIWTPEEKGLIYGSKNQISLLPGMGTRAQRTLGCEQINVLYLIIVYLSKFIRIFIEMNTFNSMYSVIPWSWGKERFILSHLELWSRLTKGRSVGKESACSAGDPGLMLGLERSSGEGNGNSFQHSCLDNSMDREAWSRESQESDTT